MSATASTMVSDFGVPPPLPSSINGIGRFFCPSCWPRSSLFRVGCIHSLSFWVQAGCNRGPGHVVCVADRDRALLPLLSSNRSRAVRLLQLGASPPTLPCSRAQSYCGVLGLRRARVLTFWCASRSSAPAHQQEGKASVAMPALPFDAQVAFLACQVRLRREDAQVHPPEDDCRRSQG